MTENTKGAGQEQTSPESTSPEAIAQAVTEGMRGGRIKNLRQITPFLIGRFQLEESDALAISQAVSQRWQGRFLPAITRMELFLTENCNLACDYCFVEGKNEFHTMSWETARDAVDYLFVESRSQKDLAIFFMGGEPFLEFDTIRRVVEYANAKAEQEEKKVVYSVTTNGTLLTEEMLAFCRDNRISFLLSWDGAPETHDRHRMYRGGQGSSGAILKRLSLMKQYQPWMGARMTVHPDAIHGIAANVRYLIDQGVNYFIIGPATGIDWSDEELDVFEEQMGQVLLMYKQEREGGRNIIIDLFKDLDNLYDKRGLWGCQAGRHSITVAANGDLYACSKMLGLNELGGIYRLGDLAHGITDVDARIELVGMWGKRGTKCMDCDLADACAGGCFATNYQGTGSVFEPPEATCRVLRHNFRLRQRAAELLGTGQADADVGEECIV